MWIKGIGTHSRMTDWSSSFLYIYLFILQYNKSSTQQCLTPKEVKVIVEKIPEKTLRDLTVSQERARESHPCGRVLRKSISACAKVSVH